MKPWSSPTLPKLPGIGVFPRLFDAANHTIVNPKIEGSLASLYVCGITPYDATHLGHAFTYLTFDTLQRVWSDAGVDTRYVQNVTDIDEPLLRRAAETDVDWKELGTSQIALYRDDMAALNIIPPTAFIAVTEAIDEISIAVAALLESGLAYEVPSSDSVTGKQDLYFDVRAAQEQTEWRLGNVSGFDPAHMLALSEERGGDPGRQGKRDPIDPCLWRAARAGEPSWASQLGEGRPGWHIECSVIAVRELGANFTVQGGGADLVFPHHELSASHAQALTGQPLAQVYMHSGLVSYQGEKMSKSRGNLVFVSQLLDEGHDASAIRLALLLNHYRSHWEWFDHLLEESTQRLGRWKNALDSSQGISASEQRVSSVDLIDELRSHLADDLDTPRALLAFDEAVMRGVDDAELARQAAKRLFGLSL